MTYDAVCRIGALCAEHELQGILTRKGAKGYKLISVDDVTVDGWEDKDWISI
jgi:hypothetical protein